MTDTTQRFFNLVPDSPARARLEEAEGYFLAGNLNEALAAAQQAWREHPQAPDVFRVLAYLHLARGEYAPAAQAAYQAVTLDADNPVSYASLAQVYLTFDMRAPADQTLTTAFQRFPDDPVLQTLLAELRFRQRREAEGAVLAQAALAHNPHDGYLQALLGAHHLRAKRYAQAVDAYDIAVAQYPQRWDYWRDLGVAQLRQDMYVEARGSLLKAYRLQPTNLDVARQLYLALPLVASGGGIYWRCARYFYDNPALGWVFSICGLLTAVVGLIWGLIAVFNDYHAIRDLVWPIGLFVGGLALMIITHRGLTLRMKQGRVFDAILQRAIEQLPAEEPA